MANEFDLGFNIASIETELPDPVITLTGSDNLTASETAEMPLLALTAYGRSWQGERVVNIADIGIDGYGIPVSSGGNYTDSNGQQWISDELVVNADGTGKIIKSVEYLIVDSNTPFQISSSASNVKRLLFPNAKTPKELNNSSIVANAFASHYPIIAATTSYAKATDGVSVQGGETPLLILCDKNKQTYTADEYKSYFTSNPVTIIYELNTPYELELTAEQLTALQPLVDKYGAFTAYFMSTQDGTPTPENPVPIVSTADLHRVSVPIKSIGDSGSLVVTTCGKNLIDPTKLTVKAQNGVSITKNDDGTFTFSGSKTNIDWSVNVSWEMTHEESVQIFTPGTYTISGVSYEYGTQLYGYLTVVYNGRTDPNFIWTCDSRYTRAITKEMWSAEDFRVTLGLYSAPSYEIPNDTVYLQIERNDTATSYEPYQSTTAAIITALPLHGIPVSSGGNYTDANGQQWICDTLEHVYGEPAQTVQRIAHSTVKELYDLKGHPCLFIYRLTGRVQYYYCESVNFGRFGSINITNYSLIEEYNSTGTLTSSHVVDPPGTMSTSYYPNEQKIIGAAFNYDGSKWGGTLPAFELADGTPVPDVYICTTGVLSDGAEIIYPKEKLTVALTTAETESLNALSGFTGSTTVYNDSSAEMTVKLLREDFEMQYIHWIKESQSFVCEKAGKYKIICVGGGSSGGIGASGAAEIMQAAGTTTSFGTIISAEGGGKSRALVGSMQIGSGALIGGQSGYDGINYGSTSHVMAYESAAHFSSTGSNSSVMWGTGHGYGAGGGARSYSDELLAAGGRCGKVESTIVDLEENQTIACTVGGGGVLKLSDANVLDYLKTYVDKETASASGMGEKVSACVSDGADGVIIIQYLGV